MIKELGILASAMSLYTGGVRSPQYRSHEVVENDIAITYKYETNELSSNGDLIPGNIYHFNVTNLYDFIYENDFELGILKIYETGFLSAENEMDEVYYQDITHDDDYIAYLHTNYLFLYWGVDSYTSFVITQTSGCNFVADVVYIGDSTRSPNAYSYFSKCENVPIESVERVYPDNIFGYVSEFIDEHLLNGIPNIDDVSYTIGGKSITMRSWLNTSICVVLAVLLIALLVWFIRYLFRLFSGLLH